MMKQYQEQQHVRIIYHYCRTKYKLYGIVRIILVMQVVLSSTLDPQGIWKSKLFPDYWTWSEAY